jgi:hypothetical protein
MIQHRSFNGKPQAQANSRLTDAFGLPLNEIVVHEHLRKTVS